MTGKFSEYKENGGMVMSSHIPWHLPGDIGRARGLFSNKLFGFHIWLKRNYGLIKFHLIFIHTACDRLLWCEKRSECW